MGHLMSLRGWILWIVIGYGSEIVELVLAANSFCFFCLSRDVISVFCNLIFRCLFYQNVFSVGVLHVSLEVCLFRTSCRIGLHSTFLLYCQCHLSRFMIS